MTEPPSQPQIVINGHQLGPEQALTVRAALSSALLKVATQPKARWIGSSIAREAHIDHLRKLLSMCGVER
jgi:hypothetical protein